MKKINIKILIITLSLIFIQCIAYYLAKTFQGNANLLTSELDNATPFVEHFVYFYVLWYLMLFLIPCIFYNYKKNIYVRYQLTYLLSVSIANIIFVIYPTTLLRPSVEINSFTTMVLNIVYYFDTPILNCFPSIHCIVCFLLIFFTFNNKSIPKCIRTTIIITSILVIVSTLLIKQHVLYDVLGSLVVSSITYLIIVLIPDNKINKLCKKINI